MASTSAAEFKQKGNVSFKAGQFARAVDLYAKAEHADPTDPVYPSNLSAALYEVGDYAGCAHAIWRAWSLLERKPDTKPDLIVRLSSRLAKALSLGVRARTIAEDVLRKEDDSINALREASQNLSSSGSSLDDLLLMWKEWDQAAPDVKAYCEKSADGLKGLSRLPIFSKPLDDRKENYTIGGDPIIDLLHGWDPRNQQEQDVLDLNKLSQEKLSELAFLFGGVGDGRHAFGTISRLFDAHKQLPHAEQTVFRTHMTMLDIHEATIARDLCMLILLEDLTHADKSSERDEIKATLMYMFLVPVMPSYCYARLEMVMEKIRTRLSTTPPNLPEWLHVEKGSIPGTLRALDYWLVTPKSTKTFLSLHEHQKPEVGHGALERTALRTGNRELKRKLDETNAEERRELKASFRSMSDERIMALSFVPQGLSPRKARAFLEEHLEVVVDALQESFRKGRETGYEEQWYERTKVLLPPKQFMAYHDGFDAAWDELRRDGCIDGSALMEIKAHITNDWKVNITLFDANDNNPKYSPEFPEGDGYPDVKYDVFEATGFMADFNSRRDPRAMFKDSIGMETLSLDVAGAFFEEAANAIQGLRGSLTIELICGELSEELAKMRHGGDVNRPAGFPRRYTRIWMSNVLDYTHGPMNMAVFIVPSLQDDSQAAAACNCLLNTSVWDDDDQYFYTYTHLLPKDIPRYLGCNLTRPQAVMEVLAMGVLPLPRPLTELASRDELTAWLTRVLFNTFVTGRTKEPPGNVRLPNNLVAFFGLLMHLHRIGFPTHWLSDFLARVLGGRMLSDIAPYTGEWPIPVSDARHYVRARQVRTDPWLVEFETIIATAYYGIPFVIATALPVDFSRDPQEIQMWEAKVTATLPFAMSSSPFAEYASPFEPTTRLLFYRPALVDPEETIKKMKPIFEGKKSPAPGSFFVLTAQECVQYESRVRFRLSRHRVKRMKQEKWRMVVYRDDNAQIAAHSVPATQWVPIRE